MVCIRRSKHCAGYEPGLPLYSVVVNAWSGVGSDPTPDQGGIRVEALRAGLNWALFPLNACPVPKEMSTKASDAHVLTKDV